MAFNIWVSTNGLWYDDTSWNTGLIPETGDDVTFSGQFSNQSLIEGPIYEDFKLNNFRTESDYTGSIGGVGNNLALSATKVVIRGTGKCYIIARNAEADSDIDIVIVNSNNLTDALTLDSDGTTNTVNRILVVKGGVTLSAGMGHIDFLETSFRNNATTDARVTVVTSGQTIGEVHCAAGVIECDRLVTTGIQSAGRWTQTTKRIDSLQLTGGTHTYNVAKGSGNAGAMGAVEIHGGTLDLTQTGDQKVVSSAKVYPNGNLLKIDDLATVTESDMTGG